MPNVKIESLMKLVVGPGEVLAVRMPKGARPEDADHVKAVLDGAFKRAGQTGVPMVFHEGDVDFKILKAADAA